MSRTRIAETVVAMLVTQAIMATVNQVTPVLTFEVFTGVTVVVAVLVLVATIIREAIASRERTYVHGALPFRELPAVDTPRAYVKVNLWLFMPTLDGLTDIEVEDTVKGQVGKWGMAGGVVWNITRREPGIELTIHRIKSREEEGGEDPKHRSLFCYFAAENAGEALLCRKGDEVVFVGRVKAAKASWTSLGKCELVLHSPAAPAEG
ncbi:MAG: hypothetical protein F4X11_13280 [Acidobacteria bacterium]|nr:hypothetical protein [Acidobacteriota bacterium]